MLCASCPLKSKQHYLQQEIYTSLKQRCARKINNIIFMQRLMGCARNSNFIVKIKMPRRSFLCDPTAEQRLKTFWRNLLHRAVGVARCVYGGLKHI